LRSAKWGSGSRSGNSEPLMFASGQSRTLTRAQPMSALHPKADIEVRPTDVPFVPGNSRAIGGTMTVASEQPMVRSLNSRESVRTVSMNGQLLLLWHDPGV
jgi:hypothetical protein